MASVFEGKAAIVTGASSGLGRAISEVLGAEGMELWLLGRDSKALAETAELIANRGGANTHCVAMDLNDSKPLIDLIEEVAAQHSHLFALINNAGVMHPEPLLETTLSRIEVMFNVNVFTPIAACRKAVEVMRGHGKPGHLINISSVAARSDRYGAYGMTKSAVDHLGRTLRYELERDDIRITTIAPGGFETNLVRGFTPEMVEGLQRSLAETGLDLESADARNAFGDPVHIANAVSYVLQQPIELNLEHITIRPAISIDI